MNKDIKTLSKWLVTKGNDSLLRIQKLLFFIRVSELKNNDTDNSYFKHNHNFQAWMYGPVSRESFGFLQPWFNETNELEAYILDKNEMKEIDDRYLKYYNEYDKYSTRELVDLSHKNKAWIIARGNCGVNEPCTNFLEEDSTFIEFEK